MGYYDTCAFPKPKTKKKKLIDAGTDPKSAREAWMLLIGRNYL